MKLENKKKLEHKLGVRSAIVQMFVVKVAIRRVSAASIHVRKVVVVVATV